MAGKRTRTQGAEAHKPANAGDLRTPAQRRMFVREVPAFDLSGISLYVINDNEFLRAYMERLFGDPRQIVENSRSGGRVSLIK